ncbi:hypothetical protein BJD99_06615 [Rhodococcus sp. 1163]|uniref:HAD-IA family hydrolase n=1 Tax=Rhodococcus sp. 1163 TaxID=1905289 RepID=UPI000A0E9BFA|nr:HAD-IA family hydrolase [Rhodococcus sp. 1163]ORI20714.1 hypothetical protein BJD99_06615 [Rhodococcus sp. 1163]
MRIQGRRIDAVLFDLDGVVTDTAGIHERAWKSMFDAVLAAAGQGDRPFTHEDYRVYIDGRDRLDAVRGFTRARGLALPETHNPETPHSDMALGSIRALADRKNEDYLRTLTSEGVRTIPGTIDVLRQLRLAGIPTAVVSASRNAGEVMALAGVGGLFDVRVDGTDALRRGLAGKPAPDLFLEAARRLGVAPEFSAVVEDAVAGIQGAQAGKFGLIIGLQRASAAVELDAEVVVGDLTELDIDIGSDSPAEYNGACELCSTDAESKWVLHYRGAIASNEGIRESLCTLGNGYFATRGALPETSADGVHYPGTYLAGCYNRLTSTISGVDYEDESIVNWPNWLGTTFNIDDGEWLSSDKHLLQHHHIALDMREGVLRRESLLEDSQGRRTWLRQIRFVSMASPHLAALDTRLEPENYTGTITVRATLDGDVTNGNVAEFRALNNAHLTECETGSAAKNQVWLQAHTRQSRIALTLAARMDSAAPVLGATSTPTSVFQETSADVTQAVGVQVASIVALYCSRDRAISDPLSAALSCLDESGSFPALLDDHRRQWKRLWHRYDLEVECSDDETVRAVRLQLFHVVQCLSPHTVDLDVGIPARGLHGEAYRGHIFWDELFVLPLLNLRIPELSRSLLLYRYRRLSEAKRRAREIGCSGALFPWQSGSDGREETPHVLFNPRSGRWMPDHSNRQFHVGLSVAYNAWHYWEVTADFGFLASYGAEMLVENARFWTSLAVWDADDDRFDIRGVMGPDEFHDGYPGHPGEGIDNSTYVNVMASWSIRRALDAYAIVGRDGGVGLWTGLDVSSSELHAWHNLACRLRVEFLDNGLLAQFHGYGELRELDLDDYRQRYGNIGRLDLILEAENDSCAHYKVSKQADVLMLLYLFTAEELTELLSGMGYDFEPSTIPATVDYYLARTTHGSTLSRVAHSWVLARGNRRDSWDMLRESCTADLADSQQGTTREGIHLGAMAGSVDILQRCYTGIEVRGDTLRLHPQLPIELQSLELDLRYRDHWVHIRCDGAATTVTTNPSSAPAIRISIDGHEFVMNGGESVSTTAALISETAKAVT